jgi:hypothetical protein
MEFMIQIKVVNSVSFRPECPEHLVPVQKTKQNGTIFTSLKILAWSGFSGQIPAGMFRPDSMCSVSS